MYVKKKKETVMSFFDYILDSNLIISYAYYNAFKSKGCDFNKIFYVDRDIDKVAHIDSFGDNHLDRDSYTESDRCQ